MENDKNIWLWVGIGVVAVLFLFGGFGMGGYGMMGGYGAWPWMSGWMIFIPIIFWAALIWFVVWLIRQSTGARGKEKEESPVEILKKRYAKGEITKRQYEQMRKALRK